MSRKSIQIEVICKTCGGRFINSLSQRRPKKYCSVACYHSAISTAKTFVCKNCGVTYSRPGYRHRLGHGVQYCSQTCARTDSLPLIDRFFQYVGRKMPNGCILWVGQTNDRGYGLIQKTVGEQTSTIASRISYELFVQPIPDGLFVCHDCPGGDEPSCINPAHLWLGTADDNNKDKVAKGREPLGIQRPNAKLTDDAVRAIRVRYAQGGVTMKKIGEEHGVSYSIVSEVISAKIWRHVTDRISLPLAHAFADT